MLSDSQHKNKKNKGIENKTNKEHFKLWRWKMRCRHDNTQNDDQHINHQHISAFHIHSTLRIKRRRKHYP